MILVRRNVVTEDWISTQFGTDDIKLQIANRMRMIDTIFTYKSEEILDFEVSARKELVRASERLNNSFSFRLFKDSICNKRYWDRTEEGGFRLKRMPVLMMQSGYSYKQQDVWNRMCYCNCNSVLPCPG